MSDGRSTRAADAASVAVVLLRLPQVSARLRGILKKQLGAALPERINTSAGVERRLLAIAPGEWAIVSTPSSENPALALEAACMGVFSQVVDLMQGWVGYSVHGPGGTDRLAGCCRLDLHPRAFPANSCARTLLGQAPVLIDRPSPETLVVYVERSLAAYVRGYLAACAPSEMSP